MSGYNLKLNLYIEHRTWRDITVPGDITFKQLHKVIQKLYGFDDAHSYDFKVLKESKNGEDLYLDEKKKEINTKNSDKSKINKVFSKSKYLIYTYNPDINWEILIEVVEEVDYDKKTVLINDYGGRYNPSDEIKGPEVFEKILECVSNDRDHLVGLLEKNNLTLNDFKKLEFEKKYKVGSRVRVN